MIGTVENNITEAVVRRYNPEKIILFGSYASRDDAGEESDLDLLIIKGRDESLYPVDWLKNVEEQLKLKEEIKRK